MRAVPQGLEVRTGCFKYYNCAMRTWNLGMPKNESHSADVNFSLITNQSEHSGKNVAYFLKMVLKRTIPSLLNKKQLEHGTEYVYMKWSFYSP